MPFIPSAALLSGQTGPTGPTGSYILASSCSAGDLNLVLDREPVGLGSGNGFLVIGKFRLDCEIKRVTSVAGATVTTLKGTAFSGSEVNPEFVASTKTIRLRRVISSISGSGAR